MASTKRYIEEVTYHGPSVATTGKEEFLSPGLFVARTRGDVFYCCVDLESGYPGSWVKLPDIIAE